MDLVIIGVVNIHSVVTTSLKSGVVNVITEYTEKFSGSALTRALDASVLGVDVGLISPVGRDAVGLFDLLKRYSVDYSHIVLSPKKNTTFMEVDTSTRHYTLYYEGAITDFHPDRIEKEYIKKAKALHICFPDKEITDYVVKTARKKKVFISADTECAPADADIVFTDGVTTGRNTVVLNFEKGITVNGEKIPVYKGDPYYENGVKDAFIAAFLARYIKSEHLVYSALYGSCAAYLCSQSKSTVLTCTKEELDTLFDEKRDL